ncbi:MAG: hypothetical protein AAGF68_04210 [Pseudomonadota bacterium]
MAVTTEIFASYLRPGRVFSRILARNLTEAQTFMYLMAAMLLGFVSQLPYVSRRANLPNPEMEAAILAEAGEVRQIEAVEVPQDMVDAKFEAFMSAEIVIWFFILPLFFYGLAGLSQLAFRLLKRQVRGVDLRMALFWALLVATPLKLAHGLFAGMIGPGPALTLVGFVWLLVFLWVWSGNLREVGWGRP